MYNSVITYFKSTKVSKRIHILGDNKKKLNLLKTDRKNKSKQLEATLKKLPKKRKLIDYILIHTLKQQIKSLNIEVANLNTAIKVQQKICNKLEEEINSRINFFNVRKALFSIKKQNIFKSSLNGKRIYTHVLDSTIKLACTNMKSIKTNFLNGNIKYFKLKYWRTNRDARILLIEKEYIKNGHIFEEYLGKLKYVYNKEQYELTGNESLKLIYYSKTNEYKLFVSKKIEQKESQNLKTIIIDQNLSPFIVGRTNNEIIKMGTNISGRIKGYVKRVNNIRSALNLTNKEKEIKERKYNRKMKNLVDEIHWKTIKYIINNYKYVVIGDVSLKEATKNGTSKLNPLTKKVGLTLKLSEFRNRLKYKCLINGIRYKEVDEWGTSKMCSSCGRYKYELKGEKIYKCPNCVEQDRDINSATNIALIYMK
jgi:IS605 OrfB family transposase